ncbi:hypothetical protein STEG23_005782 [Scotinomys teguina]
MVSEAKIWMLGCHCAPGTGITVQTVVQQDPLLDTHLAVLHLLHRIDVEESWDSIIVCLLATDLMGAYRGQRTVSDPLELEWQMIPSSPSRPAPCSSSKSLKDAFSYPPIFHSYLSSVFRNERRELGTEDQTQVLMLIWWQGNLTWEYEKKPHTVVITITIIIIIIIVINIIIIIITTTIIIITITITITINITVTITIIITITIINILIIIIEMGGFNRPGWSRTPYIAKDDLELFLLLPLPPQSRDYRCA